MARSSETRPAAVTSAWLFVVSDDRRGRRYPLDAPRVRIGRGTMNEIVTGDPRASRLHAEIRRQGERYLLSDLASTNGTTLNGQRVTETELHDGDLIQIGAFSLVLQVGTAQDILPRAVPPGHVGSAAGGAVFDLQSRTAITIGRDPTNEMVLDHPQVSRHHARRRRVKLP